jgi:hypothetical protein
VQSAERQRRRPSSVYTVSEYIFSVNLAAHMALFDTLHDKGVTTTSHQQTEANMQREPALKILNALANGVHPATGEVFAADSPYQHPDIVRALYEAVKALDEAAPGHGATQQRKASDVPANTFVRWSPEEEGRLVAAFDAGVSTAELAKLHNRSRAAIEARLLKLGKIDVSGLTVQLRYLPGSVEPARDQHS